MKKKTIVWAYLILLSLGTILSLYIPKNEVAAKDAIVIPGQAIRLRILANSDLDSDQALKRKVRDAVNAKISVWVKDLTSISKARTVIKSKLPEIQATAEEVVKEEGSKQKVHVKFGKVQFPTKLYGQFLYPAGEYEAILITLGAGKGANWWCVLFPPLCFLDFSNGIAVSKGFEDKKQSAPAVAEAKEKPEESKDSAPEVAKPEIAKLETEKPEIAKSETVKTVAALKKTVPNLAEKEDEAISETKKVSLPDTGEVSASDAASAAKDVSSAQKDTPVYTAQDEEPVKVKFFVVELWDKLF